MSSPGPATEPSASATPSVKRRFLVSVGANGLRATLSFFTGLLIARGLQPAAYGDLTFLLTSFIAVRTLLDFGTSNAYFTFISQRPRPLRFHRLYLLWMGTPVLLMLAALGGLFPAAVIDRLWFGHPRGLLILAFLATWLQQHLWSTVTQIGESRRMTVDVQAMNMKIALAHLALIGALFAMKALTVERVLLLLIAEFVIATIASWRMLRPVWYEEDPALAGEIVTAGSFLREFWAFSAPLAALAVFGFFHDFADRWMLQLFGGGHQQGFFQVAFQFASISQFATTSILVIFWKEIAEAIQRGDDQRVRDLYRKVSRGLYFFSAVLSGFLIPWTREIVELLLGPGWLSAAPVLALMFLYPVHQTLGQIASTMYMAANRTGDYLKLAVVSLVVGLPLSYLVQAPPDAAFLPGLNLGAFGMGIKMVVMNILSVNLLTWWMMRLRGWRFEFGYQVAVVLLTVATGFATRWAVEGVGIAATAGKGGFLLPMAVSGVLFAPLAGLAAWTFHDLVGLTRDEFRALVQTAKRRLTGA